MLLIVVGRPYSPKFGRERRLETRLAFLAFERFHQRGFLAADIRTRAERVVDIDVDAAALDVLAEQARRVGILQRELDMLERLVMEFAAQIVVGHRRAGRITRDRKPFDDRMRIETQDVAILAGTGFRFVRIAQDVFLARRGARHERPLQPGRKTSAAAATQRALLQLVDDRHRIGLLGEDLLPRLVTIDLEVIVKRPRLLEMQRGVDDLMFLWCGTVCHLAVRFALVRRSASCARLLLLVRAQGALLPKPYSRASRISSTLAISRFSW